MSMFYLIHWSGVHTRSELNKEAGSEDDTMEEVVKCCRQSLCCRLLWEVVLTHPTNLDFNPDHIYCVNEETCPSVCCICHWYNWPCRNLKTVKES